MAVVRVRHLSYTALRGASATARARARDGRSLTDDIGSDGNALPANDVEHGGTDVWQANHGVAALGAVQRPVGDGGVEVVVEIGTPLLVDDFGAVGVEGGPAGAQEGKDFLVLSRRERHGRRLRGCTIIVALASRRSSGSGDVAQAKLDPAVEHARVPGLVELAPAEGRGGVTARWPDVATVDAQGGGAETEGDGGGVEVPDDGVEEDEAGGEETRVEEGGVGEGVCAEGVADGEEGPRGPEVVDELDDVAGVVVPAG